MNYKFIFFLLLFSVKITAQNWVQISKTKISFSNFNPDNSKITEFEYFKKEDLIIAVDTFLANDFYKLFSKHPKAFEDIFKVATIIDKPSIEFDKRRFGFTCLDSIVAKVNFKQIVIISNREFVTGISEFIWVLISANGLNSQVGGVHYLNLVFFSKKSKHKYKGVTNGCIIL